MISVARSRAKPLKGQGPTEKHQGLPWQHACRLYHILEGSAGSAGIAELHMSCTTTAGMRA